MSGYPPGTSDLTSFGEVFEAADGIRTHDLLHGKQTGAVSRSNTECVLLPASTHAPAPSLTDPAKPRETQPRALAVPRSAIPPQTRTYRYRLYPSRRQADALETQLAFSCDLYNAALEQRIWAYRTWGQRIWVKDQQHELTDIDRGEMNYACAEMVLQRLQFAFDACFRRLAAGETPGFPRFRAKGRFNTLAWRRGQGGAAIRDRRLRIQGVGDIKVRWHRELPSEPRQTRITRRNGRWYVAFTVEVESRLLPSTGREIGVDVGINRLASLSTGKHLRGPRAQRAGAQKVRRLQRHAARCEKGSRRQRKAYERVARAREHERNRRLDRAHKVSRGLVDRFDLIAIEDLRISNMVHANRGLSREILDQGWGLLAQCLAYKAEEAGRRLVLVDPRNTSRTCAECGHVDKASRSGPHFRCTACGHYDHADTNAARNILALAQTGSSDANAGYMALPEKRNRAHVAQTTDFTHEFGVVGWMDRAYGEVERGSEGEGEAVGFPHEGVST